MLLAACSRSPESRKAAAPPPVPVTVATVAEQPVPVEIGAIGNVQPLTTVTVRSRVDGVLAQIHFEEGDYVEANGLLFTLDRGPLEAELRQAQANLAKDRAQLTNARREAERYAQLATQGFVSREQADQYATNAAAFEATVRADEAAVQNARLQVEYGIIRAPIAGRTGALQVHEGDLIVANQTPLVVINQVKPISVAFAVPEQQLPEIQRREAAGAIPVAALEPAASGPSNGAGTAPAPGAPASPVTEDERPLAQGHLTFIDNRVDPNTGTIQLKATFPNEALQLWPGQFVDVRMTLAVEPHAIVVPSTAVLTGQQGRYVYVVEPSDTATTRPVTVAREVSGRTVIAQGLRPGETVVTDGQLRLAPGVRVAVQNPATPATGTASLPAASPSTARPSSR